MPVFNDYGYGKWTLKKLDDFDYFIRAYLNIVKRIQNKQKVNKWRKNTYFDPEIDLPFHYIDMNAGPGILPELAHDKTDEILIPAGTLGSPFIFREHAERLGINYQVDFIEQNKVSAKSLYDNLRRNPLSSGFGKGWYKDHNDILPVLINEYRKWKYGLIYHDPNTGDISFDVLKHCAIYRPRYDILINFPASLFKRKKENREAEARLSSRLAEIPKKKFFIKDLSSSDIHQWTFLFMTNFANMKDLRAIELYEITKPKGVDIFERVGLTKKQLKKKAKERQLTLLTENTWPTQNLGR